MKHIHIHDYIRLNHHNVSTVYVSCFIPLSLSLSLSTSYSLPVSLSCYISSRAYFVRFMNLWLN